MTDSSRPSLPPPSDADGSAAPENTSGSAPASSPDLSSSPTSLDAAQANIPEPFREAVSALREQTKTAAETIRALRAENQRLRDKVEELSQRPDVGDDDAFAHFDDDRDALRQRIQHFIDAIDDHLDNAPESGVASGDIDPLLQPAEESPPEPEADEPAGAESDGELAPDESPDRVLDGDVHQDEVSQDGVSQDSISKENVSQDGVSESHSSEDHSSETGSSENDAPEERLYAEDAEEEDSASEHQPENVNSEYVPPEGVQPETVQSVEEQAEEQYREADPLADGLPDAAHFEVEVPDDLDLQAEDSDASGENPTEALDDSADHSDATPSDEPLLIAPGLSPRRSARRSARRGRRR